MLLSLLCLPTLVLGIALLGSMLTAIYVTAMADASLPVLQENLDAAARAYRNALGKRSAYPRALSGLTKVHLERREYRQALRRARVLVKLRPGQGVYHLLLGDAYRGAGDMTRAKQSWRKASRLRNRTARRRLRAAR